MNASSRPFATTPDHLSPGASVLLHKLVIEIPSFDGRGRARWPPHLAGTQASLAVRENKKSPGARPPRLLSFRVMRADHAPGAYRFFHTISWTRLDGRACVVNGTLDSLFVLNSRHENPYFVLINLTFNRIIEGDLRNCQYECKVLLHIIEDYSFSASDRCSLQKYADSHANSSSSNSNSRRRSVPFFYNLMPQDSSPFILYTVKHSNINPVLRV